MFSFKDKIVAITGASSGIGKCLAEAALKQGAKIAICARNEDKLTAVFGSTDENIFIVKADVSKEADCQSFISSILKRWGRVDVLINNAGISMRALFEEVDLAVLKEVMDINFWGTVYCTKYALPSIRENKGVIAGVSSVAGFRGLPGRSGYSASKFAMQGFLESLRTELLYTGANVLWVSPGFTSSNIRNVALGANGKAQGETPLDESKLMSAEECAAIIMAAIIKEKRTVVMTMRGKMAVLVNKFFPRLADKLVYKLFLKEPDSPLVRYSNR